MSFISLEAKPFNISLERHCEIPSFDMSVQLYIIKENKGDLD